MKSNLNFEGMSGVPLTRQVSRSLVTPHNLTDYQEHFSSNRQTGFLEIRSSESKAWAKRWFVFEDGCLNFAHGPLAAPEEYKTINMEKALSLRADSNSSQPVITITTIDNVSYYLKTPDLDEMRKWLFSFQKSVALVFTKILFRKQHGFNEDTRLWGRAVGDGHGLQSHVRAKRRESGGGAGLRAYTLEDLSNAAGVPISSPQSPFGRRLSGGESEQQLIPNSWRTHDSDEYRESPGKAHTYTSSRMMAISPAIPINMGSVIQEAQKSQTLASSYREEVKANPLSDYMKRAGSHGPRGDEDDDYDEEADSEARSEDGDEDEDDGDLMFDMDENMEEREAQNVNSSRTNKSNLSSLSYDNQSRTRKSQPGSSVATSLSSVRSSGGGGAGDISRLLLEQQHLIWTCGSCSKIGVREKNEDRFVQEPRVLESNEAVDIDADAFTIGGGRADSCGYFAVYDGHGGDQAAIFLTQEMHQRIIRHEDFLTNTEEAIMDSCRAIDVDYLAICKKKNIYSGTTALGAFIIGSKLVVYNIGDSMAVMCTSGVACELSVSHKPGRADEERRIAEAGGWITEEKELFMGRLHRMDLNDPMAVDRAQNMNWVTIHRVCGEISVSRSIGDPDYKNLVPGHKQEDWYFRWPDGHSQIFNADLLIPDPEFKVREISPSDEFLILASDGLWDVVAPFDAVKIIQKAFLENRSPDEAAEELCDLALRLGSSDNVTVVIVRFIHHNT